MTSKQYEKFKKRFRESVAYVVSISDKDLFLLSYLNGMGNVINDLAYDDILNFEQAQYLMSFIDDNVYLIKKSLREKNK